MSTIKNPVGPQPPAVYWRRRLLLVLLVVVVIVVIVLIVVRPGSGTPSGTPSGGASHGVSPSPGSSAASGNGSAACDPSVIALVPVTDAASYAAGVQPQLSMSITNNGARACTFDVGTDAQLYVITSGTDQIWSSKDCQTAPAADKEVLQPGKTVSTTPFAWDRTRSSTSTCSGSRPEVAGGGASYHLSVSVGDAKAKDTKQFVLQ